MSGSIPADKFAAAAARIASVSAAWAADAVRPLGLPVEREAVERYVAFIRERLDSILLEVE